jgi:hemolysin III
MAANQAIMVRRSRRSAVETGDRMSAINPVVRSDVEILHDLDRNREYLKPTLRGWMHLICFEVTLVLGTLLIVSADGARAVTAAAVYIASLAGMLGTSALYHRGNWSAVWRARLQLLDQTMIYVLIAGTAAPVFITAVPEPLPTACLALLAVLTVAAASIRLMWPRTPERVAGATYLGLGWATSMAVPLIWHRAGAAAAILVICGGVLYTIGAVVYHRRSPDPVPTVFGYHEVFHTYVCAAAACHFVALTLLLG